MTLESEEAMNDDTSIAQILRKVRDEEGYTQKRAASILGVSETTYRNYEAGRSTPQKVSPEEAVRRLRSGEERRSAVQIPLASIRANAGEGEEPFQEQVERYVTFDREAIKRETNADPSELTMVAVTGDSMQPTLNPGDRVLVVRHREGEPLIGGSIYICRSHLRGIIVKRLRWKDDQTVLLESDNDHGPSIEIDMSTDSGHGWEVLGRVVRVEKHL